MLHTLLGDGDGKIEVLSPKRRIYRPVCYSVPNEVSGLNIIHFRNLQDSV